MSALRRIAVVAVLALVPMRAQGAAPAAPAPPIGPPDELTLLSLLATPGTQARVPVYVRDVSGTLLDEGDGADQEIQSFAFQLSFPATWVDAVNFVQAGVTAGHTAFFSQVTPTTTSLTVLKSFDEQAQPLTFTLNLAPPGDLIGEVLVDLDPATPDGTPITFTLLAFNAALVDASATESETVANGHLLLQGTTIVVGQQQLFRNGFE